MNILPLGTKDKCAEPRDELPETQVPHHHFLAKEREWAAETDGCLHDNDPVRLECSGYKEITHKRDVPLAPVSDGRGRRGLRSALASIPLRLFFLLLFTPWDFTPRRQPRRGFTQRHVLASQTPTENRPPHRLPASQPSCASVGKRGGLRRLAQRDEHVSVLLPIGGCSNVQRSCRRLQEEL